MATDQLLSSNDKKEHLSKAFVRAIAAKAGYLTSENDLDRDSIDISISAGGSMRPTIGIQLKATASAKWTDDNLVFVLPRKNYDDLRADRISPAILIVMELPLAEKDWLSCSEDRLVLRRSAWWMSLRGFPETDTNSKTVHVPKSQMFTPESLVVMMEKARGGAL